MVNTKRCHEVSGGVNTNQNDLLFLWPTPTQRWPAWGGVFSVTLFSRDFLETHRPHSFLRVGWLTSINGAKPPMLPNRVAVFFSLYRSLSFTARWAQQPRPTAETALWWHVLCSALQHINSVQLLPISLRGQTLKIVYFWILWYAVVFCICCFVKTYWH